MLVGAQPGNAVPFNGGASLDFSGVDFSDSFRAPYRMELRDTDGVLLHRLPNWWGAQLTLGINRPPVLSLSYRLDDPDVTDEGLGMEVWLYEGDATAPTWKFDVLRTAEHAATAQTVQVTGYGYLERLSRQWVETYEAAEATAIKTVVAELLSGQTANYRVERGYIHPAIGELTWSGKFENQTILSCLRELERVAGGLYEVTSSGRLNWVRNSGAVQNEGHRITIGHNAQVISRYRDYTELATRIVAYGYGTSNETRITVTKNDPTAQAAYGVIVGYLNDQGIRDASALDAAAQAELDRRKTPRLRYATSVIDLSKTDMFDFAFEARALRPNAKVRLIAPGFSVAARVQSVQIELMTPTRVRISVGNPLSGRDDWGNEDPRGGAARENSRLDQVIARIVEEIDALKNDRGELESVRRAIDEELDDLSNTVWWEEPADGDDGGDTGNLDEKLTEMLDRDYGDDAGVDAAKDEIVQTVTEAITDDGHGEHTNITEAIASVGFSLVEAADRSALDAATSDGDLGRTTGTYKFVYAKIGTDLQPLQPLRAPSLSALTSLLANGELGIDTSTGFLYYKHYDTGNMVSLSNLKATA